MGKFPGPETVFTKFSVHICVFCFCMNQTSTVHALFARKPLVLVWVFVLRVKHVWSVPCVACMQASTLYTLCLPLSTGSFRWNDTVSFKTDLLNQTWHCWCTLRSETFCTALRIGSKTRAVTPDPAWLVWELQEVLWTTRQDSKRNDPTVSGISNCIGPDSTTSEITNCIGDIPTVSVMI